MSSKTRILFLIDKLVPAGTQTNLLQIVKGLDRERFQPYVISLLGGGELAQEFRLAGVDPVILNTGKIYGVSGFKTFRFLLAWLRENKVDLIQTHFLHADILGVIAGRLAGVKKIITARRDEGFWRSKRQILINRLLTLGTDKVLCNSRAVAEAVRHDEKAPEKKLFVIHNGIDVEKPSAEIRKKVRDSLGVRDEEILVGVIANMRHSVKGHRYLIEAIPSIVAKAPLVKFLFIGDGDLRQEFERQASTLGVRDSIFFLGSRRDISSLINGMDLGCQPSLSEGFSNSVLELMALAKPVVATKVGGNPEVMTQDSGILVEPKDSKALAAGILNLAENGWGREAMGAAARRRIEEGFSVERMVRNYEEFYKELLRHETRDKRHETGDARRQTGDKRQETQDPRRESPVARQEAKEGSERALSSVRNDAQDSVSGLVSDVSGLKRICHLIWALEPGGAERQVITIAKWQKEHGYEPRVVCLTRKGLLAEELESRGIPVDLIEKKPGADFSVIKRLGNFLNQNQIDLLHTHVPTAGLWGRLAALGAKKCRVIVSEHSDMAATNPKFKWVNRALTFRTDAYLVVSEHIKNLMEGAGIDGSKIKVVRNGIPLPESMNKESRKKMRESLGYQASDFVIGTVGRLEERKDHSMLLTAAREVIRAVPGARFLLVGDGPCRQNLEDQTGALGIEKQVRFAGVQQNIPDWLSVMDVFVLSSITEGISISLLEAMSFSKPCVVTRVGGNPEVVTDNLDGKLVPAKDPFSMTLTLVELLRSPDRAERLGRAARERVFEKFSIDAMMKGIDGVYRETLNTAHKTV